MPQKTAHIAKRTIRQRVCLCRNSGFVGLTYCLVLGSLLLQSGCGTQTPPPKGEYHKSPPIYDAVNPGAFKVELGEVILDSNSPNAASNVELVSSGKLRASEPVAFEGVVIHPDDRFLSAVVFVRVYQSRSDKNRELVNEVVTHAIGKNGRLKFAVEMRIPKDCHGLCEFEVTVSTLKPGQDPNGPRDPWVLVPRKGQLLVE